MPKIHVRYVTWISRRRRKQGVNKIDVVPPPPPGNQMPGDTVPLAAPALAGWVDATNTTHNSNFAFWSVVGEPAGPRVTTALTTFATMGNNDVHATAWYIEQGFGPGGPGVWIDAFDVGLGDFVDDDFVTVAPDDAAQTLTKLANEEGVLSTTAAETATAFGSIHAVPFEQWKVILPGTTASAANLVAPARAGGVAFAFFKVKTGGTGPLLGNHYFAESVKILWGVIQDGGGGTTGGPVGPWDPLIQQLMAGLAQSQLAVGLDPALRADGMALAAKQVREAATKIAAKIDAAAKQRG